MSECWRERGSNPALPSARMLGAILLVVFACLGVAAAFPRTAVAGAVITPAHYNDTVIPAGDDTYTSVVNLPFTMNWNGTVYNQIYVNMNGNCTFGNFSTLYDPTTSMATTNRDMLAPFWADVDTRGAAGSLMSNSSVVAGSIPQVNGHNAFIVNWINVGRYNQSGPLNSFQLVLIDRSDTGAGNFDIEYNYDTITWDRGTTASNNYARAGWSRTGNVGYELTGGNTSGAYMDGGPDALVDGTLNSGGVLGRYIWSVRNGIPPNSPPIINLGFGNTTIEGNMPGVTPGLFGYSGATDAVASDPDGSIASFVRSPAAGTYLPLGANTITWTATDNNGQVTTASQVINVVDSTPPTNPTSLTSSTHSVSVWSKIANVALQWLGSGDKLTGVAGYSYSWSAGAAALPDAVQDIASSGTTTSTLESQGFASATWPADWTRSDATYVRSNNARNHGTLAGAYSAEAWANNNTRRTVNFYKDYNLTSYTNASISFWDSTTAFAAGDTEAVDYSTDGGATWTNITSTNGVSTAWGQHVAGLPTGGTVRLRFSASVAGNTKFANWDDIVLTAAAPNTMNLTSAPGDGKWYFNVRTVDGAGNWATTATSLGPIWIDTVAPSTTSNAPSAWVTSSPVPVTLTGSDPGGSGVSYTRYKLDAAATATYTVPVSISGDGTHTLQFFSADLAGNVESTDTVTVRIDTTAPSVPASLSASILSTTSVQLNWNASTDAVSGVSYYAVYRNGSLVATSSAPTYTDTGLSSFTTYTYYVVAVDAAGNRSANSGSVNGTTPNSLPMIMVTNRTLEGNVANAYASYTASGDVSAIDLDGSITSLVSSPTLPATLTVGTRNIVWTATDNRGGVTTATQSVTVTDTTPPTNPALTSPSHSVGVWSSTPTVTVNWSGATDVCTGVKAYSYSWSQNAAADPGTGIDPATSTLSAAPGQGSWFFNIRTVDNAGNWSVTKSMGPFNIDTVKPTTTDNAPSAWVTSAPVPVSLTATDPSGPVSYTRYTLNGSAAATYTAAISVSTNGTNTIQYWSVDAANNVEATKTVTVRIDPTAPTVPGSPAAAAVSTTSIELTWAASSDAISGLAWYGVYRDGSLIATTSGGPYTATGLNPGQTYSFSLSAFDVAGNESARSAVVTQAPPAYAYWLSITTASDPVDFGSIDPATPATIATATIVEVGGIGNASYTLSCSATDFSNLSTASVTPTMPAGLMAFTTRGWLSKPSTAFSNAAVVVDPAGTGTKYTWWRDYVFDFSLTVPYTYDPTGTYQSKVTYTAVIN